MYWSLVFRDTIVWHGRFYLINNHKVQLRGGGRVGSGCPVPSSDFNFNFIYLLCPAYSLACRGLV